MRLLWQIADFGRAIQRQMRFGELSRAPLQLLRLEWRGDAAECDWMARPADEWDADLPQHVREKNVSAQALRDAIGVRELLFSALPTVESASLRVFRQSAEGTTYLIIAGTVTRNHEIPKNISSLTMRAKLLGFQFWIEGGRMEALRSEKCAVGI